MKTALSHIALALGALALSSQLLAEPKRPECIAPAKPGGGFDLTCKLAQSGLKDNGLLQAPMRVTYMPGGVGAVAYTWASCRPQRSRTTSTPPYRCAPNA